MNYYENTHEINFEQFIEKIKLGSSDDEVKKILNNIYFCAYMNAVSDIRNILEGSWNFDYTDNYIRVNKK
jgi:hypothetical protein